MKKRVFALICALLTLTFALVSCGKDKKDESTNESIIESIEVVEGSVVLECEVGQTPNFDGIKVLVTYKKGRTEEVGRDAVTIGDIDTTTAGPKTVKISYNGAETEITITVKEPTVTSIELVPGSYTARAMVGENYTPTGLKIKANKSDGTYDIVEAANLTIGAIDTQTKGTKSFTVSYSGFTVNAEVTVVGVNSMNVYADGYESRIMVGGYFDASGIRAHVVYSDGKTETVASGKMTVSVLDTSSIGQKEITVSYLDASAKITVTVYDVASVELIGYDSKVMVLSTYNTANIQAKVTYTDGASKTYRADELTIEAINTATAGDKTLTVSHATFTKTANVKVVGVASIVVTEDSLKSEVLKGATYSTADLEATVTYTDGSSAVLSASSFTLGNIDTTTGGDKQLSITYLDKTVNFDVKVCVITSLAVEGCPLYVTAGYELNLSNMKAYLVYNDKAGTKIDVTEAVTHNAADLDFDVEGDKILVVNYNKGEFTASVKISTTKPDLVSIELTAYNPYVAIGKDYDESSVKAKAIYSNGAEVAITLNAFTVETDVAGNKTVTVSYTEDDITKSATLTVAVLPVESITVSGISPVVNYGVDLDISGLVVSVVYSNGEYTANGTARIADGVIANIDSFNKTQVGDQTISVSFGGVSVTVTVHVKGVTEIKILSPQGESYGVREGYESVDLDSSKFNIEIIYSDGTKEIKAVSELGTALTISQSGNTFSATYNAVNGVFTDSVTFKSVTLVSVNALNGTVPTSVLKGSTPNIEEMRLTLVYKEGSNFYYYLIGIDDPKLVIDMPDFNKDVAGEYSIQFSFRPNGVYDDRYIQTVVISVKEVTDIMLVPGSISTSVEMGGNFDTQDIKVKVDFSDGSYAYLTINDGIILGSVDTATAGTKQLSITYLDMTVYVDITVVDTSAGTEDGLIYGVALPDELVARDAYKEKFNDQNQAYVVGDDNPYYFYLKILMLDDNDEIISVDGKKYPSNVTVSIKDKNTGSYRVLTNDIATYVDVNPAKNSYDFTEAAIGETFKIEISPDSDLVVTSNASRSHEVTVVDGYNIYNAWELNYITNRGDTFDSDDGKVYQLEVARNYLVNKTGKSLEEVAAISDGLKGIVLHGNVNIGLSDIPSEYVYHYTKDGQPKAYLYDFLEVFRRNLTLSNPTFAIHGNYYTVYSYNLPPVTEQGYGDNSDGFSNGKLFSIVCYDTQSTFNHKNYHSYVSNVAFRDNDPNSNDQAASERHMRGLACWRLSWHEANFYNVNIDAYYVSMVPENNDLTVNLDKVKFYNAWQGHLFIWNNNRKYYHMTGSTSWDVTASVPLHAAYQNIKINIYDSLLAKCGGPVILSQSDYKQYTSNLNSGADIYVVNSDLHSYVTGQEAWFVAVNQTATIGQILSMNYPVQLSTGGTQSNPNTGSGFLSTGKIAGVTTMNLIMLNMGPGQDMTDRGFEGSFVSVIAETGEDGFTKRDEAGNITILKQTTGLYMKNSDEEVPSSTLNGLKGKYPGAPILQSSQFTESDGGACCIINSSGVVVTDPAFMEGEYITVYVMGFGMMLEYYHPEQ